jgi:hypothetical protein
MRSTGTELSVASIMSRRRRIGWAYLLGGWMRPGAAATTTAESASGGPPVAARGRTGARPLGSPRGDFRGLGRWARRVVCVAVMCLMQVLSLGSTGAASASGWSIQFAPTPNGANHAAFSGVSCTSRAACIAVGSFTNRSGSSSALAERWNGSALSIQHLAKPAGSRESALKGVSCTSTRACTAVGFFLDRSGCQNPLVERWNGESWSVQPQARSRCTNRVRNEAGLAGVSCSSPTLCMATGTSAYREVFCAPDVLATPAEGCPSSVEALIERWNGSNWSTENITTYSGNWQSEDGGISCPSTKSCIAVNGAEFARWNGNRWSAGSIAAPYANALHAVSCVSETSCVAVGSSYRSKSLALVVQWTGRKWTMWRGGDPAGSTDVSLSAVSCTLRTTCAAVGTYRNPAYDQVQLVEAWNGTKASLQAAENPPGVKESVLSGVSCSSRNICVAVGYVTSTAGLERPLVQTTTSLTGGRG